MTRARAKLLAAGVLGVVLAASASARAEEAPYAVPSPRVLGPPDVRYAPSSPDLGPSVAWLVGQILPSPAVAFGEKGAAFGLRWQVTPILWSFGAHRSVSPWRVLVVDPVARFSGSLELYGTVDWFFGDLDTQLLRPGIRATLPLLHRGEYLAVSLGTSTYRNGGQKVAYDAGLWIFSGFLGVEATVAPSDELARAIGTVNLRVLH